LVVIVDVIDLTAVFFTPSASSLEAARALIRMTTQQNLRAASCGTIVASVQPGGFVDVVADTEH